MPELPLFDSFLQRFLRQSIIDAEYIYIDNWSVVHFGAGFLLGLLFAYRYQGRYAWLWALAILAAYEITELFLNGILFVAESPIDTIWDLIIGLVGFLIAKRIRLAN